MADHFAGASGGRFYVYDGTSWTNIGSQVGSGDDDFRGLDHNTDNNRFVVVGRTPGNTFATWYSDDDGSAWTAGNDQDSWSDNPIDVKYHSGTWVAVGQNGIITTSSNGIDWSEATDSTSTGVLNGIDHDGNNYIAVGNSGTIIRSPDGDIWSSASTIPTSSNLFDVQFAADDDHPNGVWLAVGAGGTLIYSEDAGLTWVSGSSEEFTDLMCIAHNNSTRWFVGADGTYQTTTTVTGTWFDQFSGTNTEFPVDEHVLSADYYDGTWIIGCDLGAIVWTTDFINWNDTTIEFSPVEMSGTRNIVPAVDIQVDAELGSLSLTGLQPSVLVGVVVDDIGTLVLNSFEPSLSTSTTTQVPHGSIILNSHLPSVEGFSVPNFIVGGDTDTIWMSTDAITWNSVTFTSGDVREIRAIVYDGTQWVAAGDIVDLDSGFISISDDNGATWSYQTQSGLDLVWSMDFDGVETYVAVWDDQSIQPTHGLIWNSFPDAESWFAPTDEGIANDTQLYEVKFADGRWVAVGAGIIVTSTEQNANTWSHATVPVSVDIKSVTHDGNQWLAVGASTILTSPNGTSWTEVTSPGVSENWEGVHYAQDKYIAVGANGTIATSTDGTSWTEVTDSSNVTTDTIYDLSYSNGVWVAVTDLDIYSSPDGDIWTQRQAITGGAEHHIGTKVVVSEGVDVVPDLGTVTITGSDPTIDAHKSITVDIDAGNLIFTGLDPLERDIVLNSTPALVINSFDPQIDIITETTVPLGTITISTHVPSLTDLKNVVVTVSLETILLQGLEPILDIVGVVPWKLVQPDDTSLTAHEAEVLNTLDFGSLLHGDVTTLRFRVGNITSTTQNFTISATGNNSLLVSQTQFSSNGRTYNDTLSVKLQPNEITNVIFMKLTVPDNASRGDSSVLLTISP